MHRTYIADIERGARNLTLRSVEHLADALQVTVGNLLSYATAQKGTSIGLTAATSPSELREILIVEDNRHDAALALRSLKRARFMNPIKLSRDAEEALEYLFDEGRERKLGTTQPQLILLDLYLPRMSGLDLLRRLKGDKRTQGIPVVILTAIKNDKNVLECARLGAEGYIMKPLDIEGLVSVIPQLKLQLTLSPPMAPQPQAVPQ